MAATEELRTLFTSVEVSKVLARRGTEWRFIPRYIPWFAGFWERLIGLIKTTLMNILGRTHATVEDLRTIVWEVEALLNDRPIT